MNFSKELISWYQNDHRDLPWRNTQDPYRIWLSEIILQQTRVDQGLEYYHRFIAEFPTVKELAEADEDLVLKLWQGLGYYSRARNLHKAARIIADAMNGVFPSTYRAIIELPGVGPYTAAAIASFAFKEKVAVVDGNVYRVLSRIFGIDSPIDMPAGQKEFKTIAQELIDEEHPDLYNQAIMEFGATCCKPKLPQCPTCIFNQNCIAQKEKKIDELPVKSRRTKVKEIYLYYAVQKDSNGNLLIRQRAEKGIWHKLFDFPGIESEKALEDESALKRLEDEFELVDLNVYAKYGPYSHLLSHRRIQAYFYLSSLNELKMESDDLLIVNESKYGNYAIPRLIEKFWQDIKKGASPTMF